MISLCLSPFPPTFPFSERVYASGDSTPSVVQETQTMLSDSTVLTLPGRIFKPTTPKSLA
jgi:hypothetical protein